MPPISQTQRSPGPESHRLTVEAAAAYLGMSKAFLNKARLYGGGPTFLKLGSRVFYDRVDLDTWLQSRRRTSTSATIAA